jgi:hypothetical protein
MSLRDYFWWPSTRRHVFGFAAAAAAVCFLGLAQIPGFPSVKDLAAINASARWLLLVSAVIGLANFYFLYEHASGDFLDQRRALRPIGATFVVLSIAFPVAWALYRLQFANAAFPDFRALFDGARLSLKGAAMSAASLHEWLRGARVLFVGEGALTAVLLYSGLWRDPPKDTLDLGAIWSSTRPLVRRVFCDGAALTEEEHERLQALLTAINEGATTLLTHDLRESDRDLANELRAAAAKVQNAVRGPHGALENLRKVKAENKDQELLDSVRLLLGKRRQ